MSGDIVFCHFCCAPIEKTHPNNVFCNACEVDLATRKLRALAAEYQLLTREEEIRAELKKDIDSNKKMH